MEWNCSRFTSPKQEALVSHANAALTVRIDSPAPSGCAVDPHTQYN